jgi:hypothetical protein
VTGSAWERAEGVPCMFNSFLAFSSDGLELVIINQAESSLISSLLKLS